MKKVCLGLFALNTAVIIFVTLFEDAINDMKEELQFAGI
jgi:hypothetical protein